MSAHSGNSIRIRVFLFYCKLEVALRFLSQQSRCGAMVNGLNRTEIFNELALYLIKLSQNLHYLLRICNLLLHACSLCEWCVHHLRVQNYLWVSGCGCV